VYALPNCINVIPGCRAETWGDDVRAVQDDLRLLSYRCKNISGMHFILQDGLHFSEVGWDWENLGGPENDGIAPHERMAILATFKKEMATYVEFAEKTYWGKYPDPPARNIRFLAGHVDSVYEAVINQCAHKGEQVVTLPDGIRETVTVM